MGCWRPADGAGGHPQRPVLDRATVQALTRISQAGCGTSMVFLSFTVVLYVALRWVPPPQAWPPLAFRVTSDPDGFSKRQPPDWGWRGNAFTPLPVAETQRTQMQTLSLARTSVGRWGLHGRSRSGLLSRLAACRGSENRPLGGASLCCSQPGFLLAGRVRQ